VSNPSRCDLETADEPVREREVELHRGSPAGEVAVQAYGYEIAVLGDHLRREDLDRVCEPGRRARPPVADLRLSMPRLAFVDDCGSVCEQSDDRLGIALCLEREVAIDDLWDLSGYRCAPSVGLPPVWRLAVKPAVRRSR
jgi:hypothetical protein